MKRVVAFCVVLAALAASVEAGSVVGRVTYDDVKPPSERIVMDEDPECVAKHNRPVYTSRIVLGDDDGIANVFVRIMNVPRAEYEVPSEPVVLDRAGCLYEPRVVGLVAGQPLLFKNSDGILHNVHGLPKDNPGFEFDLAPGAPPQRQAFKTGEAPFKILCDRHPWEIAYVGVLPHPLFAITDRYGVFEIHGLPDGDYHVQAWHEQLGSKEGRVSVSSDTAALDFTFEFKHPPR